MCLLACVKDGYRKPNIGMWNYTEYALCGSQPESGVPLRLARQESFFVGDAAGRKSDHSDADIGFAKRVKMTFFDEDVFFRKSGWKQIK